MEIRKATADDIRDISRIHALSWKRAYKGMIPQAYLDGLKEDFWVPAFQNRIESGAMKAQIVFDGHRPIGCGAYGKSRDATLPDWGEIVSLYLIPEYFGRGFGKRLFQSVLEDLHQDGFQSVYLWVLDQNQRARDFYERNGFCCNNDRYVFEIMGERLADVRYVCHFQ